MEDHPTTRTHIYKLDKPLVTNLITRVSVGFRTPAMPQGLSVLPRMSLPCSVVADVYVDADVVVVVAVVVAAKFLLVLC